MSKKPIVYKYKGSSYDYIPLYNYTIIKEVVYLDKIERYVVRKLPIFAHISVILILLSISGYCMWNAYRVNKINSSYSITYPSTMYFDCERNILNIDLVSDSLNEGIASIRIYDDSKYYTYITGICAGDFIGGIKVDTINEDELPISATIKCEYFIDEDVVTSYTSNVLIVNQKSIEGSVNSSF